MQAYMIMAILCGSAVRSVSTIETSVNFDGAISSITSCKIALIPLSMNIKLIRCTCVLLTFES